MDESRKIFGGCDMHTTSVARREKERAMILVRRIALSLLCCVYNPKVPRLLISPPKKITQTAAYPFRKDRSLFLCNVGKWGSDGTGGVVCSCCAGLKLPRGRGLRVPAHSFWRRRPFVFCQKAGVASRLWTARSEISPPFWFQL